jgi:general stress protein 26
MSRTRRTLADIARKMSEIDFAMLLTHSSRGHIAGRPMSNNRDVDYNGDSYYFAWDGSHVVREIERDPRVALTLQGEKRMVLGRAGIFICIDGSASVSRDQRRFAEHWNKGLDRWFRQGAATPGLVMIKVRAKRVNYWEGEEEGEIKVE